MHLAKIPEYKGFYSYNHAILNEDIAYGVTLHWMTEKVDLGEIAYQKRFLQDLQEDIIPHIPMQGKEMFYSKKSLDGLREIQNNDSLEYIIKSKSFLFSTLRSSIF